ncbi:MAG: DNA replication/repair protein RecF [Alphaproteobacteria bacterium]|nr:DNA replication/repair protein RecF [Alphaproteobacteria bacterium]
MAPDRVVPFAKPLPRPAEAAPAAAVARLVLTDFRGYDRVRLAVEPGPVVLVGANGSGKTNLLEAISFLAPGRGLRRARLSTVDRRGGGAWALAATVTTPAGEFDIGTGRDAASESGERRHLRIDGAPAKSQQDLSERLAVVWLTPQMDRLFADAAAGRRRFLDRLVAGFDPDHWSRLLAYERAMRERGRLLREGAADPSWLKALEEIMAETGVALAAARLEAVARLAAACAEAPGPFPRAGLAVEGTVEAALAAVPALAAEEEFRRALRESRALDRDSGVTQTGPHRSDLLARHFDTGEAAAFCSTGEQKALLIAIVLAYARLMALRRGACPVLLLDEITAHLDAARRSALFQALLALGAQSWLAGTDAALFAEFRGHAQFFAVADAALSPA